MPRAEVDVDVTLVRGLLADQAPQWAGLPLHEVARGWDNAIFRLGADLAVRVPLRALAAPLIVHEARWLPVLAPVVPVAVPVPRLVGGPALGYPWRWSVVPWVEGRVLAEVPVAERTPYAAELAEALVALHRPAPEGFPPNPYRGVALSDRAETRRPDWLALARAHGAGVVEALAAAWERGYTAPAWPGPPLWLHGDPHPLNVVVDGGAIAGLIDFGDLTAGDPASDLATAWLSFDAVGRRILRTRVDTAGVVDPAVWDRAGAWAAAIAAALLESEGAGAELRVVARHTAEQLAAD